jgi:hypothetical protein
MDMILHNVISHLGMQHIILGEGYPLPRFLAIGGATDIAPAIAKLWLVVFLVLQGRDTLLKFQGRGWSDH